MRPWIGTLSFHTFPSCPFDDSSVTSQTVSYTNQFFHVQLQAEAMSSPSLGGGESPHKECFGTYLKLAYQRYNGPCFIIYTMTIAVSLVQYTWFRVITGSTSQEGGISFERSDLTTYIPQEARLSFFRVFVSNSNEEPIGDHRWLSPSQSFCTVSFFGCDPPAVAVGFNVHSRFSVHALEVDGSVWYIIVVPRCLVSDLLKICWLMFRCSNLINLMLSPGIL
jgi:hypothetical protein